MINCSYITIRMSHYLSINLKIQCDREKHFLTKRMFTQDGDQGANHSKVILNKQNNSEVIVFYILPTY